jgi:replicative DNA helicase
MPQESVSTPPVTGSDRAPPYSDEAEKGVLGSVLLDAGRVMDLCVEGQLQPESFYVPAHGTIYEAFGKLNADGGAIDPLTVAEYLRQMGQLEKAGGAIYLDRLIDATPTSAHAEYYIDIVRQKHLLRSVISCSRESESWCYNTDESADSILSRTEQAFLDITERQHGTMKPWRETVKGTMKHIEAVFQEQGPGAIRGISTGLIDLDRKLQGLKPGEMIVLAARPSMGKTSLAMNIAENVALGNNKQHTAYPVGVFSLEMSAESLVMRMLCSLAKISSFKLTQGIYTGEREIHGKLTHAASRLMNAPIVLDDTGGLDVMELRARARRMKKKHDIRLIMVDYLQLLHCREYARQGRQIETSQISGHLKAMAKELKLPVLVLSQLSRAPEQRDKRGRPKLSDLRDSGAIEQDADVVCMLRRPCRYEDDPEHEITDLAYVDVAKQRNGPTGEIELTFVEEFMQFKNRLHGVDDEISRSDPDSEDEEE